MIKKINTKENNETKKYGKIDARSTTRTGRIVQFATSVTPEFDRTIRELAQEEGLMICEVLERSLNVYIEQRERERANKDKN